MEYLTAIGSIAVIWFFVVAIPGPNFLVVTQVSMTKTREKGFFTALGVSMGAGVWASASLMGLSMLFRYAGWMYDIIKIIGGCYLIYMGMKTIWYAVKRSGSTVSDKNITSGNVSAFKKGLLTSFSNPKTAVFFGSLFLSAFPPQASIPLSIAAVLTVVIISIFWYSLVVFIFSFNKIQIIYLRLKKTLDIMTGSLLSFLGVKLIFGRT